MSSGRRTPSNETILQQLRDRTAEFNVTTPPVSQAPEVLPLFARIGSSLTGISPAMKKLENYSVQKVTGDGRCMFRALVKGMARNKGLVLSPSQERDDADELRMAVKEVMCDSDVEPHQYKEALIAITVEESLKRYCQRIGRSDFWGGESELLVLSRLCHQPITVYIPAHQLMSRIERLIESQLPASLSRTMEVCFMASSRSSSAVRFLLYRETYPRRRLLGPGFSCRKVLYGGGHRSLVIIGAKKSNQKPDTHSFVPKPDEATGLFPEAVLLKKKIVKEDGRVVPEFADAEEEKLYEFLKIQLESDLKLERMRHYEVVYLIHEDNIDDVDSVVSKVQDFIKEKKGRIWRLNNWGLRTLSYKIKKASKANYILMNFEIEAKLINDFKTMLDKDERIIRHLVIKRDEAITEDCPPPPEFHTIRAAQGMNEDYDEEEEEEEEEEEDNNWLDDGGLLMEANGFEDDGDGVSDVDGDDFGIACEVSSARKLEEIAR